MANMLTIHQIADFLYLSGVGGARKHVIHRHKITCVVNCCTEVANLSLPDVEYFNVCVIDAPEAEIGKYFDTSADKIEEHRLAGGKVLVHCVAGVSRSASVTLAYFVKYQQKTLREAYLLVSNVRPIVCPNHGFWKQLIDFERRVRNEASVQMIREISSGDMLPDVYNERLPAQLQ